MRVRIAVWRNRKLLHRYYPNALAVELQNKQRSAHVFSPICLTRIFEPRARRRLHQQAAAAALLVTGCLRENMSKNFLVLLQKFLD
jgi:hypothetical protein